MHTERYPYPLCIQLAAPESLDAPEFLDTLSPEQGVVTVRPIPGMFTNDGGNDDAD